METDLFRAELPKSPTKEIGNTIIKVVSSNEVLPSYELVRLSCDELKSGDVELLKKSTI